MKAEKVFRVLSFIASDGREVSGQDGRGSLFLTKDGDEKRVLFVRDSDGSAIAFTYTSYDVVPMLHVPQRKEITFQCPSGKARTFVSYKELEGGEADVRTVSKVEVMTGASQTLQLGEGVNDRDVRRKR